MASKCTSRAGRLTSIAVCRRSTGGAAGSMSQPDQPEAIPEEEEVSGVPTPEQLEIRLTNLLETCTYVVFNYIRRGLFDRDKLIVLTLLTFQIMLKVGKP